MLQRHQRRNGNVRRLTRREGFTVRFRARRQRRIDGVSALAIFITIIIVVWFAYELIKLFTFTLTP